jgi:hypothetical protein
MVTRKGYVLTNKTARAILDELDLYAKDKQFYPVKFALLRYMQEGETKKEGRRIVHIPGKYPELTFGSYNYWFNRLVDEGYIEMDWTTKAIRCLHLIIVEREDILPP